MFTFQNTGSNKTIGSSNSIESKDIFNKNSKSFFFNGHYDSDIQEDCFKPLQVESGLNIMGNSVDYIQNKSASDFGKSNCENNLEAKSYNKHIKTMNHIINHQKINNCEVDDKFDQQIFEDIRKKPQILECIDDSDKSIETTQQAPKNPIEQTDFDLVKSHQTNPLKYLHNSVPFSQAILDMIDKNPNNLIEAIDNGIFNKNVRITDRNKFIVENYQQYKLFRKNRQSVLHVIKSGNAAKKSKLEKVKKIETFINKDKNKAKKLTQKEIDIDCIIKQWLNSYIQEGFLRILFMLNIIYQIEQKFRDLKGKIKSRTLQNLKIMQNITILQIFVRKILQKKLKTDEKKNTSLLCTIGSLNLYTN